MGNSVFCGSGRKGPKIGYIGRRDRSGQIGGRGAEIRETREFPELSLTGRNHVAQRDRSALVERIGSSGQ